MLTGWSSRWKIESVQNSIASLALLDRDLKFIKLPSLLTVLPRTGHRLQNAVQDAVGCLRTFCFYHLFKIYSKKMSEGVRLYFMC